LKEQKENTKQSDKLNSLKKLRDMAIELKELLNNNASPNVFGEFLHKGWMLKKQLASSISNNKIDEYYEKALSAGALGGKISGAGGGGFLLLYCRKEKQTQVKEALNHLRELAFSFEPEESKIICVV